ncbi:MAG: hypothetical protein M3416_03830, partial [Acidobacteriota bacterium]|nr:hypothetical protein [Acidobacteriota bacterium]
RWVKVLLVVGVALALLCAAAAGLGVYLWRRHGRGLVEGGQQAFREGREFGGRANSQECLVEAIERHRRAGSLGEVFRVNLFLRGCLEACTPTPGFCDGVPGPLEFVKTAHWSQEQCRRHGLSAERQCGQLFAQVQQYCAAQAGEPR